MSHVTASPRTSLIENVFIVYLAVHPTQGSYVGMTQSGLSSRRGSHVSAAKRGSLLPFHKALRASPCGWQWSILGTSMDRVEAGKLEASAIKKHRPSLNIREGGVRGGTYPADFIHGGKKNGGRKKPQEFREWVTEFHRTRPRKRMFDRDQIRQLAATGMTQTAIAEKLGCNQSVVSNTLSGKSRP